MCGFGAGVLMIAPVIKALTCCLIIPIAGILSVILDQKANPTGEKITLQKGLVLGLLTGFTAGVLGTFFEVIITFITHSNDLSENIGQLQEIWKSFPQDTMVNSMKDMFYKMAEDIETRGFSLFYTVFIFANNVITGLIFGLLGGLIGMKIGNTNLEKQNSDFN